MGVDISFMELSARKSGSELEIVPHDVLRQLNVVNDGYTREEWSVQAIDGMSYVRGERDTFFGHQKILLFVEPVSKNFYFVGIFETRNREEELNMMAQIDMEINSHNIDVSSRNCRRKIYNGYFHIYIPISVDEAREIATSASAGVMMRFTSESPMFLGISGMKLESGRHLLNGLINAYAI